MIGQNCGSPKNPGDTVRKEHDHAMDDMRYFVTTGMQSAAEMPFFALSVAR